MRKYVFIAANEGHSWGGSEPLWSSAAKKLARSGEEVCVSVKDWGKPVAQIEDLRSAGCKIVYRRPPSFLSRQVRKVLPLSGLATEHLRSVALGANLVVISQGANIEGLQWMEAARVVGLKYAIIAQGAAEQWWPADDLSQRLADCYEQANCAYFVSQANVNLSRMQFATPLRNAKVVRNPFNVQYDARPPWPVEQSGDLALACVARLDVSHKGQDLLLQVLSLPKWRERPVRLSLVGKGINERGLRWMVEQLKLSNIAFTGHVDDIEGIWSKHHVLVLASRYEGMPLALVEAMICGRPCIVTDVAGHRELVRDDINGFLAEAATVSLLDKAMNRAWDNRDRLKEMGRTAGQDVRHWVSRDPADDFARELAALISGSV